jgi:hypothetical protein
MSKTISNAPILTNLSVATKSLNGVVASLALEAVMTGKATLSLQHIAMLAEGVGTIDASVREALGIEVERLEMTSREPVNPAPSPQTIQEFLNERRANQEAAVRSFSEQRDEAGFAELKGMAEQPASSHETLGFKFVPIGSISMRADASPEEFAEAIFNAIREHAGKTHPTTH